KSYKNLQGLGQHESLIHSNYNIPQVGLIPQPLEAISEFKKSLKLCFGVGAYEVLGQIFNDSNWGVREYKNQQQTWVVLVSQNMSQM
ncbi:2602_t:CDS:2, partial [Dentiscutata erythropus]